MHAVEDKKQHEMYRADNRLGLFIPNLRNLHLCWTTAGQRQILLLCWGFHTACLLSRQPLSSALPQAWWFAWSVWVKATKQNTFVPCNPQTTCVECKTLSGFLLSQLCPSSLWGLWYAPDVQQNKTCSRFLQPRSLCLWLLLTSPLLLFLGIA